MYIYCYYIKIYNVYIGNILFLVIKVLCFIINLDRILNVYGDYDYVIYN